MLIIITYIYAHFFVTCPLGHCPSGNDPYTEEDETYCHLKNQLSTNGLHFINLNYSPIHSLIIAVVLVA